MTKERAGRIYPVQLILDQHHQTDRFLTMTAKAFPRKKRPYMFAVTPTANALYARWIVKQRGTGEVRSTDPTAALISL